MERCLMLLSFDPKYWSICQNLKDKEKKIKEAITFLQKQINMEKEDHQQYYLYTALSNTVKDHLAEKNGPHQFWCKRRNCILIHLQKAYRCGLDRSCSSCKYALLWQVSIFFQRVGHCTEGQKKEKPTKQPWEYMKNTFHSELKLNIFILKPG